MENFVGNTALIIASLNGHLDVVQALMSAGADLNVQGQHERTALSFASEEGHLEVVKALVTAGAELNLQDKGGMTALILGSTKGHQDIVKALVAAGAELNLQDKYGDTAWSDRTGQTAADLTKDATIKEIMTKTVPNIDTSDDEDIGR